MTIFFFFYFWWVMNRQRCRNHNWVLNRQRCRNHNWVLRMIFLKFWSESPCWLEARNFAVILILIPFKTYEKTSFTEKVDRSFTNTALIFDLEKFSDFRERALGPVSRRSRDLFGPEKLVAKLQSICFEKLIF